MKIAKLNLGQRANCVGWKNHLKTLSVPRPGSAHHGTITPCLSNHAIAPLKGMTCQQSCQNPTVSTARPSSEKRARRNSPNSSPRSRNHRHQRRTVCRSTPACAAHRWTESPLNSIHKTTCCRAQSYQRRGATHSGNREQVCRQP